MAKDGPSIVSNSTAATFGNSPQKTGEPVDRLSIYSGKALEFDGVGDFLSSSPTFATSLSDNTLEYTVACWVYLDSTATGAINILSHLAFTKYLAVHGTKWQFGGYLGSSSSDYTNVKGCKSTDDVVPGVWHRVVGTYDGSEASTGFKLYINGELLSHVASESSIFSANVNSKLVLGRVHRSSSTADFAGKLCDYQLWNTTWSLADVTYDYLNPEKLITSNSSVSGSQTVSNLQTWYAMNDTGVTNPQTVIFDGAGTNNTTKAHGTTTFFGDDKLGGNGGFDATSNWSVVSGSVGTEWTINDSSNSKAVHNTSNANTLRYTGSSGDLVNGTTYQVDFTIADRTAGSITIAIGGAAASSSQTASGSIELTAGGSSNRIIDINPTSDFDGSIDSVTVKEVGIATGYTDADQQQYIPQTAFMDGCTKNNFDGVDDYISLGNADSLNNIWDGGGSVSAWIFPTALPSGNGTRILCKKQTGHNGWYIALSDLSGSTCDLNFRIDWDGDNYDISTSSRDITLNEWNHIVVVYNSDSTSNTASIFINGSSKTITSDTPTGTRDDDDNKELRIGGQLNSGGSAIIFPFEGIVDEVAIFNKELSANLDLSLGSSEIALLYNSGQPHNLVEYSKTINSSSNLIGYFKNNNLNSEGKWKDQISTNHGTINGTPDHIFFQQGVTANLCTQGYSNNIVHPSKGSMHFLGKEYAAFPGERIISLDGDFTIEFWFKKTQIHAAILTDSMLFGSGNNQIRIPSGVSSGKMSVAYLRDASGTGSYEMTIHSDNRKSIYEWSHVTITRESGTIKTYIDAVTTNNTTISATGQMNITTIGALNVTSSYMYKGFLDDLRVYDKALSAPEVTKNYKNTKSQHKNS